MTPLDDDAALARAVGRLADADPRVAAILARVGPPPLRRWAAGFATLVDIICGQQVSRGAADSMKTRLRAAFDPFTPAALAAASEEALRACGLSRQKIRYVAALATACRDRTLDLDALAAAEDEAAIAALTALPGIGRWTAEVYLLFAHGRPDLFPAADLALAEAYRRLADEPERRGERALRDAVARWAPDRGAAAHLLWHSYRAPDLGTAAAGSAA